MNFWAYKKFAPTPLSSVRARATYVGANSCIGGNSRLHKFLKTPLCSREMTRSGVNVVIGDFRQGLLGHIGLSFCVGNLDLNFEHDKKTKGQLVKFAICLSIFVRFVNVPQT
jgi:hypothetical protein